MNRKLESMLVLTLLFLASSCASNERTEQDETQEPSYASVVGYEDLADKGNLLRYHYQQGQTYLVVKTIESLGEETLVAENVRYPTRIYSCMHEESIHSILAASEGDVRKKRIEFLYSRTVTQEQRNNPSETRNRLEDCVVEIENDGLMPVYNQPKGRLSLRELGAISMHHETEYALLPKEPVREGDTWTPDIEALRSAFRLTDIKSEIRGTCTLVSWTEVEGDRIAKIRFEVTAEPGRYGNTELHEFSLSGLFLFSQKRCAGLHLIVDESLRQSGSQSKDATLRMRFALYRVFDEKSVAEAPKGFDEPLLSFLEGKSEAPAFGTIAVDLSEAILGSGAEAIDRAIIEGRATVPPDVPPHEIPETNGDNRMNEIPK
ncbi:MAG: hypothetical protein NUW37_07680 [Planctomycetes bacterium]|nr:hypothetical protein [Planctomycetota bacterium]